MSSLDSILLLFTNKIKIHKFHSLMPSSLCNEMSCLKIIFLGENLSYCESLI